MWVISEIMNGTGNYGHSTQRIHKIPKNQSSILLMPHGVHDNNFVHQGLYVFKVRVDGNGIKLHGLAFPLPRIPQK